MVFFSNSINVLIALLIITFSAHAADIDQISFIEKKLRDIHIEMGEISAKVAFCQEYGNKRPNYFFYGTKIQQLFGFASGSVGTEACLYIEDNFNKKNYCDATQDKYMEMMWAEYSKWKYKLSDLSFDIEKGCIQFIPEINQNNIYRNTYDIYELVKSSKNFSIVDEKELNELRDLKIKE